MHGSVVKVVPCSVSKKRVFELCGTVVGDLEASVIVSDKVVDNVAGVIVGLMLGAHVLVCQFF